MCFTPKGTVLRGLRPFVRQTVGVLYPSYRILILKYRHCNNPFVLTLIYTSAYDVHKQQIIHAKLVCSVGNKTNN